MSKFTAEHIRNFALIGHSGEGKTSLAEAILFNAGVIDRMGTTNDGTSVMDFDAEEINRKISIGLSIANCVFKDVKFNIIDVPGFFDFEGEMASALHVADGAIIVVGSDGQLAVGTEKAINYCIKNKKPCMIFINQIDKENADFYKTFACIDEKYPNAKVIVAHVGRAYIPSDVGDAFEILKHTKNLYFDFSANTSDYAMQKLFESVSSDRILFGTDMPFSKMRMYRIEENGTYVNVVPRGRYGDVSNDPHMKESDEENISTFVYEELLAFKRAATAVGYTREDIEKIMYKNAEKLFDFKI
jgi:small GTP-binding protein